MFQDIIKYFAFGFEITGSIVVIWGGLEAIVYFAKHIFHKNFNKKIEHIRCILGHKMLIALDFFLAGDILSTVNAPDWNSLGMLGVLVVIRTVLNHFLRGEIHGISQNH